jgi:hypothetical protein
MSDYVSPLAKLIAARKRIVHEFDVSGFFKLGDAEVPKLGFRVPTKAEQDKAIDDAHLDITRRTKSSDSAKSDEDITRDLKTAHILHKSCLDPAPQKTPDGREFFYPAFPSPGWMCENMSTEQIGTLLNLLNSVRARESPEPDALDDATVESFHAMVVAQGRSTTAAEFLAGCGREFSVQLYLAEALRLEEARNKIIALEYEIEARDAVAAAVKIDVPPDTGAT